MIKKLFVLSLFVLNISCAELGLTFLTAGSKSGSGPKHYKYQCEKAGECCEVGVNCDEQTNKNTQQVQSKTQKEKAKTK